MMAEIWNISFLFKTAYSYFTHLMQIWDWYLRVKISYMPVIFAVTESLQLLVTSRPSLAINSTPSPAKSTTLHLLQLQQQNEFSLTPS